MHETRQTTVFTIQRNHPGKKTQEKDKLQENREHEERIHRI